MTRMYCVFTIAILVVQLYLQENNHTLLLHVPTHAVDANNTITESTDLPIHPELIYRSYWRADPIFY